LRAGVLAVDRGRHEVHCGGKEVRLTPTEFNLLELLVLRRGRVQSREVLLNDVWQYTISSKNWTQLTVVDAKTGNRGGWSARYGASSCRYAFTIYIFGGFLIILCAAIHLFAARAIDTVHLTLVPRILGGAEAPTMVGGRGLAADEVPDSRLAIVERVGDELYLQYELTWL
jgi:hypothetical protein